MGRLGAQLLGLAMVLFPLCLLLAGPLIVLSVTAKCRWWQITIVALMAYLSAAGVAGVYGYVVVPADYTRAHLWTLHPTSSSLGDQHGHALVVAAAREAAAAEEATWLRERVARERRGYLYDWLWLTLSGLAVPLLVSFWGVTRARVYRQLEVPPASTKVHTV